jgi:FliI/YscN family ATPase
MDERARLRAAFATAPSLAGSALVGRLTSVQGNQLRATLPDAAIGATVRIERAAGDLRAEIVGFSGEEAVLLPWAEPVGLRPGAPVHTTSDGANAPSALDALGQVINALGERLTDHNPLPLTGNPLRAPPPSALRRQRVTTQLQTGLRVLDGLLPLGIGQRVGLFAGSGVGKSVLLSQLTRGVQADACVVALIGERGREVGEFVEELDALGSRARTTVVVATSDEPPLMRMRAALLATALAEEWRDQGAHCLLLVDSLTRYARALREAALAAGEPPARRGYPASVFAALPRLLERAGPGERGAISAIYTVLVDGGDLEEPVADEVRGIVDGHIVLSRSLAERGHFPAIDVLRSVSRVTNRVVDTRTQNDIRALREVLATLERQRDAIDLGIYRRGTDARIDAAIELAPELDEFLRQRPDEFSDLDTTFEQLAHIAAGAEP